MALIVQKFGGSSLVGEERLRCVAERIAEEYWSGNSVIAVLSARGSTTDDLLRDARKIAAELPPRDSDLLLTVGEQIAIAHMAILLHSMGLPVTALTGWQAGIVTDGAFGDARIRHVRGSRIRDLLEAGNIVLVAGFQGVTESGEITTLGRGGSDTTAVALAAFLRADACRIFTDVDGVYTADPRLLPRARKLDSVTYADMLEMAAQGAKVLHDRSVELARDHGLVFEVCSSFSNAPGTVVGPGEGSGFCGVSVRQEADLAAVSLIGSACGDAASAVLEAMEEFPLQGVAVRPRCITAYLPAFAAKAAAERLHDRFLPEKHPKGGEK